jgi:hypothetical protein
MGVIAVNVTAGDAGLIDKRKNPTNSNIILIQKPLLQAV